MSSTTWCTASGSLGFREADNRSAAVVANAAKDAEVRRIVYRVVAESVSRVWRVGRGWDDADWPRVADA